MEESSKRCKLIQHQKSQQKHYAGEEIVFCTKDFPFLAEDDIVEVYNPEEDYPRLLLKVGKGSLRDDYFAHRDALSIEQSIAGLFQLKPYSDVLVKRVRREDVELDSVELTFKDQYLGRSEMWRLKNSLIDTCLYLGRKIEFASSIRCLVHEMWSHGDKVASGLITPLTKIVFRSSTSMVYLFIQMSSEMWEFDIHGDLYFEKAVNGFLAQLFGKWKRTGSNHEVTIVLFSRLYYEATTLDLFPDSVKLCLQTDYKGRFYEDYYRIAVQNGKYDDWGNTLIVLKHIFVDYQRNLLLHHRKGNPGVKLPKSSISSASRGNFLEVLNMSLNVFEKHYKDRSFDRTGQLSVVITPGVGVFEVDRELTNLTMQRIIDNGVGSDLVCVGEQPLHAVPLLLKFNNKTSSENNVEDYSMPHWINLSFYSTKKKVGYSSYIPRIKLPMLRTRRLRNGESGWDWTRRPRSEIYKRREGGGNSESPWPNSVYDFDDYDQKIFGFHAGGEWEGDLGRSHSHLHPRTRPRTHTTTTTTTKKQYHPSYPLHPGHPGLFKRQNSEPEIHGGLSSPLYLPITTTIRHTRPTTDETDLFDWKREEEGGGVSSPAIPIPIGIKRIPPLSTTNTHLYSSSFGALNIEMRPRTGGGRENWFYDDIWSGGKAGSSGSSSLKSGASPKDNKGRDLYMATGKVGMEERRISSKALINPFDPSHALIKLTSSRRRWTHIFPRGPTGTLIQQHHRHSTHSGLEIVHEGMDGSHPPPSQTPLDTTKTKLPNTTTTTTTPITTETPLPSRSGRNSVTTTTTTTTTKQSPVTEGKLTLLWGATGEQEWTPALQTGVDWKSLTIPACLPLTTDYLPEERSLETDYVVSDYSLLPDDVNADYAQQRLVYRHPLTTVQVFAELISQRLAQGFQLVVRPTEPPPPQPLPTPSTSTPGQELEKTSTPIPQSSGSGPGCSGGSGPSSRPTNPLNPGGGGGSDERDGWDCEEYILSIGRVFHKIQLEGSTITVTRYRPKHAYPSLKFEYTYRLNSPHSSSYEVSASVFSTEKLENYSWNYLDHYICTRGDKGYGLHETLKFWRFRMYLMPSSPSSSQGTKRILEGSTQETNIYTPFLGGGRGGEERRGVVENFLKFMEGVVNRLKRATCPKKPKILPPVVPGVGGVGNSSTTATSQNQLQHGPFSRERSGSTKLNDKGRPKIGLKDFIGDEKCDGGGGELHYPESLPSSIPDGFFQLGQGLGGGSSGTEGDEPEVLLPPTTSLRGILESMCLPNSGFSFVKSGDLPHWTFLSGDAVNWLMRHMEGIETELDGVEKYQGMLVEGLISHASGNVSHRSFLYGFLFYSIRCFSKQGVGGGAGGFRSVDVEMFEDDWMEVGVDLTHLSTLTPPKDESDEDEGSDVLLCGRGGGGGGGVYKGVYLDVDLGKKSERQEWGHLNYQSEYKGNEAFEMVVQWVQGTGSIITELIQGWSRKAQQCNMQLIPIPSNPFGVSSSYNSDSLRCPIFIPLETEGIGGGPTSQDFDQERMTEFQMRILSSFGFIPCLNPSPDPYPHHHFVHLTGNMFVSIPNSARTQPKKVSGVGGGGGVRRRYESPGLTTPSHEDFITRHVSGKKREGVTEDKGVGFLWSWNYMVSKRWKTSSTLALGDETFMMRVLRDFQGFCKNQDNRLITFWTKVSQEEIPEEDPDPTLSPTSTSKPHHHQSS